MIMQLSGRTVITLAEFYRSQRNMASYEAL